MNYRFFDMNDRKAEKKPPEQPLKASYFFHINHQLKLILLIVGNVLPVLFFLQLMNSEATLPFDLPQPVYPLIPDHISGCITEIHDKKSGKGKGQN